jgi:phytoene/squalene synthetase
MSDDIADNNDLSKVKKQKILNFFKQKIKDAENSDVSVINNIIQLFKVLPSAKKYSLELLKAFMMDTKKKRYKNFDELIFYCNYSANPVGRFFIYTTYRLKKIQFDNKKEIFRSSDSLCTALQIINHLQDCKDDFNDYDRVYIPLDYFRRFSLDVNVLKKRKAPIDFIFLKNELISKVEDLLLDTENGLKLIKEWRLRKETFIILNIAKRLCFLLKNNDPLEKKIKLTRIDLIYCFIKGIIYD